MDRKTARHIAGYTFAAVGSDPENWMARARMFNSAAELMERSKEDCGAFPFYYNSALSIELALKATAIANQIQFEPHHRLPDLCSTVGLSVTKDQICTLELLSELLVWSARYPVPNKEGQWHNYHDVIQEKHLVREREGNVGRTLTDPKRFPTLNNYRVLWARCEELYESATGAKA